MPWSPDTVSHRAVAFAVQEEVAHHVASFMLQDLRRAYSASACQTPTPASRACPVIFASISVAY